MEQNRTKNIEQDRNLYKLFLYQPKTLKDDSISSNDSVESVELQNLFKENKPDDKVLVSALSLRNSKPGTSPNSNC